jgi:hypothetical protein
MMTALEDQVFAHFDRGVFCSYVMLGILAQAIMRSRGQAVTAILG